jgi:Xaa-Pro aminopeptidase
VALEEGMIISNEPGLYLADRYGIRCENLVVVEQSQTTDFGKFLRLRTVTLFPFDSKLIEVESLTDQELEWLNSYHAEVRARLTPLLSPEEAQWLKEKTEPIKK